MRRANGFLSVVPLVVATLFATDELMSSQISHLLVLERNVRIAPGLCKGLAFDGTNFLIGLQSATNRELSAQMITSTGTLAGASIPLGRSGSPPVVAFDGTNYLLVWSDFANPPADIFGQFVARSGEKVGDPFLIRADEDAAEAGAIDFDGLTFFVVWAANSQTQGVASPIRGQRVSSAAGIVGDLLQISDSVEEHQYPVVAFDGTNHLVCWEEKVNGTNLWNVKGRFVSREGVLLDAMTISEHSAFGLYPLGLAVGKTNYLVAWDREVGPFVNTEYTMTATAPYVPTNLWYPMIHGRLVSQSGSLDGPEFQISRAKWRQTAPGVAFDGLNYLVSWIDGRDGHWNNFALWRVFAQRINPTGQLLDAPFAFASVARAVEPNLNFSDGLTNYPPNIGPVLRFASHHFLALWYLPPFEADPGFFGASYAAFVGEDYPVAPLLSPVQRAPDGTLFAQVNGDPKRKYSIEASTNLTDWSLLTLNDGHTYADPGTTFSLPNPSPAADRMFFRGVSGRLTCLDNLRRLKQAKSEWALDYDRWTIDYPYPSDIFGPGKYVPSLLQCPHGGTYSLWRMDVPPTCSLGAVDGHTL